jgi:intracellular septation protein
MLIKHAFGQAFQLDEQGWRGLTWRWAAFFIALAIANEIVWRSFSTNTWVAFKVWGVFPLILVFSVAQLPFLGRHQVAGEETPPSEH